MVAYLVILRRSVRIIEMCAILAGVPLLFFSRTISGQTFKTNIKIILIVNIKKGGLVGTVLQYRRYRVDHFNFNCVKFELNDL